MPAGDLDSGRYQIGRLLGRGGLGEVYLAHDRTLGRDVAIKFVTPDKVADPDARRALLREARAAAALDHPNICTVFEAGETADGRGFIVMQYVEGPTLATVLHGGPLPIRDALALSADIAEALAAAHKRGIIHRDLKPGNIIVTPSGRPKLVDFGIAKVLPSHSGQTETVTAHSHASTATVIGTPAYMSPEQIRGRAVDGRSDLFGLGLVLFECLTGRRAFAAPSSAELFADILHVHPPAPSTLRPELSEAHDQLCWRLLAKDPADRFQSADEVVGAIRVLLPATGSTPSHWTGSDDRRVRRSRRTAIAALVTAIAGLAGIGGVWIAMHRGALPSVPKESDVWYRGGTEALREGAYHRARMKLEQAIKVFPEHALAHARLAEAAMELDDPGTAATHMLRVTQLVPNPSRLPTDERLRLEAVRAMVLRDVDRAVSLYRELADRNTSDARARVDLGRAQEAAEQRADARTSYEQAIAAERQYAPAYLRLGTLEGDEARTEPALAAFREAERLYEANSDLEGKAEVRLSRGAALDGFGRLKEARADLEAAVGLAKTINSIHQQVRAQLSLSSVIASEGRYADAERMTTQAIDVALANRLETLAAIGLTDLAATQNELRQYAKAEELALRAIGLAESRKAARTAARARVQLAEVQFLDNRSREALATVEGVLPFLKQNRYRRFELTARLIAARARESLDELDQARRDASEVLTSAEALHIVSLAVPVASTLASITTSLGDYPEALRLREQTEAISRRQGDASLPYILANRADLLLRLGRQDDAALLLAEIDAGIAAGIDSFKSRRRRITFLRAFAAATSLRCTEAVPLLDTLQREAVVDLSARLVPSLRDFCAARAGGRPSAPPPAAALIAGADPATRREHHYWTALAALLRGDSRTAASEADAGLKLLARITHDELRWRMAAVAAVAGRRLHDGEAARRMSQTSQEAYDRLRTAFKGDFASYQRRPDLAELRNLEQTR